MHILFVLQFNLHTIFIQQGLQWFCNKRANYKVIVENKAPLYFLQGQPTLDNEETFRNEMTEFTKHIINNKRKHTDNDIEYTSKLVRKIYLPQNE